MKGLKLSPDGLVDDYGGMDLEEAINYLSQKKLPFVSKDVLLCV